MAKPISITGPTAQAAKAAQRSVCTLLENLKATKSTTEALTTGLCHRLSSIDTALGKLSSALGQSLSHEIQYHLRLATWSNGNACVRFQDTLR
ncbi:hypothetical protein N7517_008207 [Penicillium concentricum]|uniref:Uncharacterized protein n=1 Tax=Penicillium concentricum TaxID=293559 RepID=A0A9W9V3X5_9EURO|nr:uncharacterized protein N7517_008207 [Penicillium concentricum]KAJ5365321.1 hypothetical protein N7517_008207 [Penicillium concentricum]